MSIYSREINLSGMSIRRLNLDEYVDVYCRLFIVDTQIDIY